AECPAWSSLTTNPTPGSICPDTDGDGDPDIFDDDNDGDGVPDDVDLSPFTVADDTFNRENPFSLTVNNLKVNEPVFVNVQMRPTEPENITYFGQVIDWPSNDDKGQVQRVFDTNWTNTSDTSNRSTADNASFGDVRVIPMLEISMPWQSGHYANLPVKSGEPSSRSQGTSVDDWLDDTKLTPYSISVKDVDANSGDLVAYVPLTPQKSGSGGSNVAFTGRMLYWPTQGTNDFVNWGSAQTMRLVWMVQMITDTCPENNPECSTNERVEKMNVIHLYDDDWHLAGLEVVEDRGLDVGILYEDPANDENLDLDQQLWAASWFLSNTFMRGRDCAVLNQDTCTAAGQDGQRDVRIDNVISQLDGWSTNTSYIEAETFSYEHEGFMTQIMMTESKSLLDTHFASVDTNPTLLFLQEKTRRARNLDEGAIANSSLTFDFAGSVETLTAAMSWASYYDADSSAQTDWKTYTLDDYLNFLDGQLQLDDYFKAVTSSQDDIDEAGGRRLLAQIYYASLYNGQVSVVEQDAELVWVESADLPENLYEPDWPPTTFYGATFVTFSILTAILNASVSTYLTSANFFKQLKYAFSYNHSFYSTQITRGLKNSRVSTVNFATAFMMFFIATGLVLFAIGYFGGDENLVQMATIILNIATVVVLSAWLVSIVRSLVKLAQLAAVAPKLAMSLVSGLAKSSRAIGAIGLIIAITVAWGFFIYSWASGDIKPGTVEFNIALALAIAQTIVIIVLFILEIVFGLVASIIIILLFIIDAILAIAGETGVIEYITNWLANEIYDVEYVLHNLDDPERLNFEFTGVELENVANGFASNNAIFISMNITTKFDGGSRTGDAKRATVRYLLDDEETDNHSGLGQNNMTSEWSTSGKYIEATQSVVNADAIAFPGPGINRDMTGRVYLNEGIVIPYEGCWQIPIYTTFGTYYIDADCTWYDIKRTNHFHLGEHQVYDVLPATIGDFMELSWALGGTMSFPAQKDSDNDGLLSQGDGGADPNDGNADSDGDGLWDAFELDIGSNPQSADTDNDGLSDPLELEYNTNILSSDSDGDGLDDYTETIVGWLVVYNDNNDTTRVWSDPNVADADNDTLNDLEEFVFGFNPWTPTDPSIINTLITFDNMIVNETGAAKLLYNFDEPASSTIFADSSGSDRFATCDEGAGECPVAGEAGWFNQALEFDGSTDRLSVPDIDLNGKSFTIAGWVWRDGGSFDMIMHHADTSLYNGFNVFSFPSGQLGCDVGISQNVLSPSNFAAQQWLHWACTFDAETRKLTLYANGQEVASRTTGQGYQGNGLLSFGYSQQGGPEFWLDGKLDEVVLFEDALSDTDVARLYNGRFAVNDLLVAPGAELTYQATATSAHPSQFADGLFSGSSRYIDPVIGVPDLVLGFEGNEKESTFAEGVGQSNSATCLSNITCPLAGVDGAYYAGVEFDGVDDYLIMPPLGENIQDHTIGFWLKLDATPTKNVYVLDTETTADGALDIYVNSSGQVVYDVAGLGQRISDFTFTGNNLGKWHFFGYRGGSRGAGLYVNPADNQDGEGTSNFSGSVPEIILSPSRMGNNYAGTGGFPGGIDDFVLYDVGVRSPTATNAKEMSQRVYQGIYWFDYVGSSPKRPIFLLEFNEVSVEYDKTYFLDHQKLSEHAVCESSGTCPTLVTTPSLSGYALEFDGNNDYLQVDGTVANNNNDGPSDFLDMTFNIYPHSWPANGEFAYLFNSSSTSNNWLDIYLNHEGKLLVDREGSTIWDTRNTVMPVNQWTKVRVRLEDNTDSGNLTYQILIWVDDVLVRETTYCSAGGGATNCHNNVSRIGNGRIGRGVDGNNGFDGVLDDFDIAVGNYTFDFESTDVGYINSQSDGVTARCPDALACPTVATGKFGDGALFDGVDDYLTQDPMDFATGDYTIATWFKSSATTEQTLFAALDQGNGRVAVHLEIGLTGRVKFTHNFPTVAGKQHDANSNIGYNDGQWHFVVASKQGDELTLTVDGSDVHVVPVSGHAGGRLDIEIGRDGSGDLFNGTLDELVVYPTAALDGTFYTYADALEAGPYPPIGFDEDFILFNLPALSSVTVEGTATVDENVGNSYHLIEEEIEAALQLQSVLSYPIVDGNAATLDYFLPFEEVPNSSTFLNVSPNIVGDWTCSGDNCPTSGLRGKVGRAVLFDGVDDYLRPATNNGSGVQTMAAWVKADRGTIASTVNSGGSETGLELDVNRFRVVFDNSDDGDELILNFTIPENEWTHVVATYNTSNRQARVYINGSLARSGTTTLTPSNTNYEPRSIGTNFDTTDPLNGYLDDVRFYTSVLNASAVQALYSESAAQLNFEFDEDEEASAYLDKSANGLVGQPRTRTCTDLSLDSVAINGLTLNPSLLLFVLDNSLAARVSSATAGTNRTLNTETMLCNTATLRAITLRVFNASSAGSVNIDPTNTGTFVHNFTSGGNDIALTYTVGADPETVVNPAPGTDGKIGNTALFDGLGYIQVDDANAVTSLSNDFTIMGWIMPDSLPSVAQEIVSTGDASSGTGFSFFIHGSELRFRRYSGNAVSSGSGDIEAEIWQHVAVVFDGSNQAKFYIDGTLDSTVNVGSAVNTDTSEPLFIGTRRSGGVHDRFFKGQIDELAIFNRAMDGAELFNLYLRELRWYRDRATAVIRVDADNPVLNFAIGDYHDNSEIDLVLSATDATSRITYVEWGLKAPSDSSYMWQRMPVCTTADGEGSNAVFCSSFDPSTMDGEGIYQLRFVGVDAAGNETEIFKDVFVDDTAPDSLTTFDNSWQTVTDDPNYDNVWTFSMNGIVHDPDIALGLAGSGVRQSAANGSHTIWITGYDENGHIAGDGRQPASISNEQWSIDYRFSNTPPQGGYSFTVEVEDRVGNKTTHNLGSYRFDARAPSSTLYHWEIGREISQTTTLNGLAIDQTDLGGSLVQLHFEEPSGATMFYDSSLEDNHGTCTSCPLADVQGLYGTSVLFNSINNAVTVPNVVDPAATEFTAAVWFRRTANSSGSFVSQTNGTGIGATWLRINPSGQLRTELVSGGLVGQTAVPLNEWHHAAVSYDGATLKLYLDGKLENETDVLSMTASDGNHVLGTNKNGGQAFGGMLDEFTIYERALLDSDIYGLSRQEASGINQVEVWLEPFLFTGEANTEDWNVAGLLNVAGSKVAGWQYPVGSDIEGYYRINHRATDENGYTSGTIRGWRGVIDTQAPRISFSIGSHGFGSALALTYGFTIDDLFLDEASIVHPCGHSSSPLTFEYDANTGVVIKATGTCRETGSGHIGTDKTISACDVYGHCTTVTRTIMGDEPSFSPRVVIYNPIKDAILPFTGGAVTIDGGANDEFGSGVSVITISDQNGLIDTLNFPDAPGDTTWSMSNWTPATPGTYTLTAQVNGGHTDVINVTFVAVDDPVLSITNPLEDLAELKWVDQTNNCTYNVRRSNAPYSGFSNLANGTAVTYKTYVDDNNIGVVEMNDYYNVERVSCPGGFGMTTTNTVGEFDFEIVPGN
ncbi:MAG: LamG-like jellyroll fold domain-containing protein, partial [Chloroflexota bacterium]